MRVSLNYNWRFVPDFKNEFLKEIKGGEIVNIPHTVKEVPYNYFSELDYQIVSTYEKKFDVDNYDSFKDHIWNSSGDLENPTKFDSWNLEYFFGDGSICVTNFN